MTDALIEITRKGDLTQKEVAAVGLSYVGTDAAKDAVAALHTSSDARVSLIAMSASAGMGDEEALTKVRRIITHGKGANAEVAARTMGRWPPSMAAQATQYLIDNKIRSDPAARMLESWRQIEHDAESLYRWGLEQSSADVRMQTIWLIAKRGADGWMTQLDGLLQDTDRGVRGMAAWAIIRLLQSTGKLDSMSI